MCLGFLAVIIEDSKGRECGGGFFFFNFSKRVLVTPKSLIIPGSRSCRCYA